MTLDAGEVETPVDMAVGHVQLHACGFGAGAPQLFAGRLLIPAAVRVSDYCNLDEPILRLEAARGEGKFTRFALAKEALDGIWTLQPQPRRQPVGDSDLTEMTVRLQTRLLDVVGTLQVAPGADPFEMLMTGKRRFVPLSSARVSVPGVMARVETGMGVCLVNRAHVVAAEPARKPAA